MIFSRYLFAWQCQVFSGGAAPSTPLSAAFYFFGIGLCENFLSGDVEAFVDYWQHSQSPRRCWVAQKISRISSPRLRRAEENKKSALNSTASLNIHFFLTESEVLSFLFIKILINFFALPFCFSAAPIRKKISAVLLTRSAQLLNDRIVGAPQTRKTNWQEIFFSS
jgi:hypothetical protein